MGSAEALSGVTVEVLVGKLPACLDVVQTHTIYVQEPSSRRIVTLRFPCEMPIHECGYGQDASGYCDCA